MRRRAVLRRSVFAPADCLDAADDHFTAGGITSRNQRLFRHLDSTLAVRSPYHPITAIVCATSHFGRLRSNREDRKSQGRIHRTDARLGRDQTARRTGLVVRAEVRRLSHYRREGGRASSIVLAQRKTSPNASLRSREHWKRSPMIPLSVARSLRTALMAGHRSTSCRTKAASGPSCTCTLSTC
jgi:hypothetical protein